ncbi:MAG: hypothetical protein ABIT20_22405 [Gemmatimonadaceae bacterium]
MKRLFVLASAALLVCAVNRTLVGQELPHSGRRECASRAIDDSRRACTYANGYTISGAGLLAVSIPYLFKQETALSRAVWWYTAALPAVPAVSK